MNPLTPCAVNRLATDNLRRLRRQRGMALGTFAQRVGITKQALREIETGQARLRSDVLIRSAEVLDVGIPAFFADAPRVDAAFGFEVRL